MDTHTFPRLYTAADLAAGRDIALEAPHAHYLRNVLRLKSGGRVRLFNGQGGEWLGEITGLDKKSAQIKLLEQTKTQPPASAPLHLLFAPLKKDRLDFLIEKSVELGAAELHPVITARTEVRKINEERIRAQITEAAEQCERLDLPKLHPIATLEEKLRFWDTALPLYACLERYDAKPLKPVSGAAAFLIGPVGGFEEEEKAGLAGYAFVRPVSLGDHLLRAETAALKCLSLAGSGNT